MVFSPRARVSYLKSSICRTPRLSCVQMCLSQGMLFFSFCNYSWSSQSVSMWWCWFLLFWVTARVRIDSRKCVYWWFLLFFFHCSLLDTGSAFTSLKTDCWAPVQRLNERHFSCFCCLWMYACIPLCVCVGRSQSGFTNLGRWESEKKWAAIK